MPAPEITFTVSGNKISDVSGFDHISVSFFSDLAYTQCEVRATKIQDAYGRGVGRLIAAFSARLRQRPGRSRSMTPTW